MWLSTAHRFAYNIPTMSYGVAGSYDINLNKNILLEASFLQQVHRRMFGKTWRWAGQFRKSNKNIGVDWTHISIRLRELLEDVKYQCLHQSYSIDEIAVRFHHRLVFIHPFPNGNGRHSRLVADLFLTTSNTSKFSWRQSDLYENSVIRKEYIKALQAADKHDYKPLLEFVRR